MSSWELKTIEEVLDILDKNRKPLSGYVRESRQGKYPYCGANGVVDHIDDYIFDGDYILLAEDGGHWGAFESTAYQMKGKFWVNNHAHILKSKKELLINEYLLYRLIYDNLNPHITGDSRGKLSQSVLKAITIKIPSLSTQKKIAYILSTTQNKIENIDKQIQSYTDLKKSVMEKLFTEGLRGEKQKETEIGMIPESWEVVELSDVLTNTKYGTSSKLEEEGKYPVLRINSIEGSKIVYSDLKYLNYKDEFDKYPLEEGDLLFNRTNSIDLVGKVGVYGGEKEVGYASYLIRLQPDRKRLDSKYLAYYLNSSSTQIRLKKLATRAISQANINATKLKKFVIPLPNLNEQNEISRQINLFQNKIDSLKSLKENYRNVFNSMLHKLMNQEIEVDDLDINT